MIRLVLGLCFVVAIANAGVIPETRIVGGEEVPRLSFNFQVSIRDLFNRHLCSGVLVSPSWVLTTASCIKQRDLTPRNVIVVAGTYSRLTGGTPFGILQIFSHPFFNWNRLSNDVALLRIAGDVPLGVNIRTIALASNQVGSGVFSRVAGWGRTAPDGDLSEVLTFANQTTLSNDECRQQMPQDVQHLFHDTTICAVGSSEEPSGNCYGDSGNPLVDYDQSVLIGLASWGIGCAEETPDVYTRLSVLRSWIDEQTVNSVMWLNQETRLP